MPKPREIDMSDSHVKIRIRSIVLRRQNGRCFECGEALDSSDKIVARGYKRRYYHSECARKLNII